MQSYYNETLFSAVGTETESTPIEEIAAGPAVDDEEWDSDFWIIRDRPPYRV